MKKVTLLITLIFLSNIAIKAQKKEISYGVIFGLNNTFFNSNAAINYDSFQEKDRNISLNTSNSFDFGYNAGAYFKIQPLDKRLSFETGILITNYNNTYSVSLNYEDYVYKPWNTIVDNWTPTNQTSTLKNDFRIINIPATVGYDILKKSQYNFTVLWGITLNISMKNENAIEDNPLYKDFYLSYHAGIMATHKQVFCKIIYERSLNIQKSSGSYYFEHTMNVDKIFLNSISISLGINLNQPKEK